MNKIVFRFSFFYLVIMGCCPFSFGGGGRQFVLTTEGNVFTLSKGDVSISVSAESGGRIVSLMKAGKELLIQDSVHPKYYGSTFWLSPQNRFWPPSAALDELSYRVEQKRGLLRLISWDDSLTGFRFIKEFSISKDTAIVINYKIQNISDTVRHVAPWDVSRVPGGRTFFPVRNRALKGLTSDLKHVQEEDGMLWYTYSTETVKRGQKLFALTSEGWLAHQYKDVLFIKTFPQTHENCLPPMQGEVEVFLAPKSLYVELENHGDYVALQPKASLTYRQKWYLCSLSSKTDIRNEELERIARRRIGALSFENIVSF